MRLTVSRVLLSCDKGGVGTRLVLLAGVSAEAPEASDERAPAPLPHPILNGGSDPPVGPDHPVGPAGGVFPDLSCRLHPSPILVKSVF